jgi:hypothetical protein
MHKILYSFVIVSDNNGVQQTNGFFLNNSIFIENFDRCWHAAWCQTYSDEICPPDFVEQKLQRWKTFGSCLQDIKESLMTHLLAS